MARTFPLAEAAALYTAETNTPAFPAAAVASSVFLWGTDKRSKRRRCSPEHCKSTPTVASPPHELSCAAKILIMMSNDTWDRASSVPIIAEPPVSPSSAGGQDDVFRHSPSIPPSPSASWPSSAGGENLLEVMVKPTAPALVLGPESLPVPAPSAELELISVTSLETLPVPVASAVRMPLSDLTVRLVIPATSPAPVLSQAEDLVTAAVRSHVPNLIPAAAAPPVLSQARKPSSIFHACSQCDDVFSSYQALGGHMTKHRKPATVKKEQAAASSAASSSGRIHQCKICPKTFPTGQALGGHMRLHYDRGTAKASYSAHADASGTSTTTMENTRSSSVEHTTPVHLTVGPTSMDVEGAESMSFALVPATSAYEEPPTSNVERSQEALAPATSVYEEPSTSNVERPQYDFLAPQGGGLGRQPTFFQFF